MKTGYLLTALALLLFGCRAPAPVMDTAWPTPATARALGQPVGVGMTSDDQLVVLHRGKGAFRPYQEEDVVFLLDPATGEMTYSWGNNIFLNTHGLHIDAQDHVWLTDTKRHQVFKFTKEGELLLFLGENGVAGLDESHFDQPTDVAIAADGSIFVTDGYGNRRVVKFDAEGNYLMSWGKEGDGPGEFVDPHAIDIATNGELIISDRENSRIQIFDQQGNFLREIATKAPVYACVHLEEKDRLLATDYFAEDQATPAGSAILVGPRGRARIKTLVDRKALNEETIHRFHDIATGPDGTIYAVDLITKKLYRFRPGTMSE